MTNDPKQMDLGGDVADLDDEQTLTIELPVRDAPDVVVALLAAELLGRDAARPDFEDTIERARGRVEERLLDGDAVEQSTLNEMADRLISLIRLHSNDFDIAAALHLELGHDEYQAMRKRDMLADMDGGDMMGMLMGPNGPQPVDPSEMPAEVREWLVEHAPGGAIDPDEVPEFVVDWLESMEPDDPGDHSGGDPTFQ